MCEKQVSLVSDKKFLMHAIAKWHKYADTQHKVRVLGTWKPMKGSFIKWCKRYHLKQKEMELHYRPVKLWPDKLTMCKKFFSQWFEYYDTLYDVPRDRLEYHFHQRNYQRSVKAVFEEWAYNTRAEDTDSNRVWVLHTYKRLMTVRSKLLSYWFTKTKTHRLMINETTDDLPLIMVTPAMFFKQSSRSTELRSKLLQLLVQLRNSRLNASAQAYLAKILSSRQCKQESSQNSDDNPTGATHLPWSLLLGIVTAGVLLMKAISKLIAMVIILSLMSLLVLIVVLWLIVEVAIQFENFCYNTLSAMRTASVNLGYLGCMCLSHALGQKGGTLQENLNNQEVLHRKKFLNLKGGSGATDRESAGDDSITLDEDIREDHDDTDPDYVPSDADDDPSEKKTSDTPAVKDSYVRMGKWEIIAKDWHQLLTSGNLKTLIKTMLEYAQKRNVNETKNYGHQHKAPGKAEQLLAAMVADIPDDRDFYGVHCCVETLLLDAPAITCISSCYSHSKIVRLYMI
jgi:hypothetical protein